MALCISKEGRPPARISWLSSLDWEAKETQVSGTLAGTVTVTSRFTLVPSGRADGVTVTCKVEHESFEEPALIPVTLSVRCECIWGDPSPIKTAYTGFSKALSPLSLNVVYVGSLKPNSALPSCHCLHWLPWANLHTSPSLSTLALLGSCMLCLVCGNLGWACKIARASLIHFFPIPHPVKFSR